MQKPLINYAYIDGQNLYMGIKNMGWELDWKKFRRYLQEKYQVRKAYIFIGYLSQNKKLYNALKKMDYSLVFKEVIQVNERIKGNCDAELVLQVMIDYEKYEKAVIVSGDGDFACLVRHLKKQAKLQKVLVPNIKKYSALLKKAAAEEHLDSMNYLKEKLAYMKSTQ